ncbi:hypothetical protein BJ742DRAFT_809132 [Cladochytrium replicatum]|nr:hypothetical protein BJ742DRAFT_809132 [Cladochytrium replicatum]
MATQSQNPASSSNASYSPIRKRSLPLSTHIILRLIIPIAVSMLALAIAIIVVVFVFAYSSWVPELTSLIVSLQLAAFSQRAASRASIASTVLDSVAIDTLGVAAYFRDLFAGPFPNVTTSVDDSYPAFVQSPAIPRPYASYFGAQLDSADPPSPSTLEASLYSLYYRGDILTRAQFAAINGTTDGLSAVVDNAMRAYSINKPTTQAIQIGFPSTGWRRYPYEYSASTADQRRNGAYCTDPSLPANLTTFKGYNPQCRSWYQRAVSRSTAIQPTSASGLGPATLTTPYIDSTTKRVVITASQAIRSATNALIGVVGIQIYLDTVSTLVTSSSVLDRGYMYMIDSTDGTVALYPAGKSPAATYVYQRDTNIAELDFNNDTLSASAFLKTINAIASGPQPPTSRTFLKPNPGSSGSEPWRVSAAKVNGTSYLIVLAVPESDIEALSASMRSRTTIFGSIAAVLVLALLVVATWIAWRSARSVAEAVLEPVRELSDWLDRVAQADLDVELGNKPPVSAEINTMYKHFSNLLVAVRFGNDAYYRNDLARALENYEAAEKMMVEFKNLRGQGVVWNNKGNAFKQGKRNQEALDAYTVAIQNAETLAANETDPTQKRAYLVAAANRRMNLGVFYKDREPSTPADLSTAHTHLIAALDAHRTNDNLEGLAQASGNLGQLYIQQHDLANASKHITESYDLVKARFLADDTDARLGVAMQYAAMNMGMLREAEGRLGEAVAFYTYVLQRFETLVAYVRRSCAAKLVELCEREEVGRKDLAEAIVAVGDPLLGDSATEIRKGKGKGGLGLGSKAKDVLLLLDVSGSMAGSRIKACQRSIDDILTNQLNTDDRVSFMTFGSSVEVVIPFTSATPVQPLLDAVQASTRYLQSSTKFWLGLYDALRRIHTLPVDNKAKEASSSTKGKYFSSDSRPRFVIALTDGEDTSSPSGSFGWIVKYLQSNGKKWTDPGSAGIERFAGKPTLRSGEQVCVVVITVGDVQMKTQIKEAVKWSKDGGFVIEAADNVEAISGAFGKAVEIMKGGGNLNVERL